MPASESDKPSIQFAVQREELLDLIDREIERADKKATSTGWSRWAILGAAATCSWLLIDATAQPDLNWTNVFVICMCAIFLREGLIPAVQLLGGFHQIRRGRFFFSHDIFSPLRLVLLLELLIYAAIFVGLNFYVTSTARPFHTARYLAGGLLCASVVAYAMVLIPLPVPATPEGQPRMGRKWAAAMIVAFSGGCLVVALYVTLALVPSLDLHRSDIRVSGLVVAIVAILWVGAYAEGRSPTMESLVGIRRSLVLGHVDVTMAKNQLEIALLGMGLSEALSPQIERLLQILRSFDAQLGRLEREIETFERLGVTAPSDSDAALALEAIRKSILSLLKGAAQLMYRECVPRFLALYGRARMLSAWDADNTADVGELRVPLQERTAYYNQLVGRFFAAIVQYLGPGEGRAMIIDLNSSDRRLRFEPESGKPPKPNG